MMKNLISEIQKCIVCANFFENHKPRPVLRASKTCKILVVGQAPGTKVHSSGIPWDDQSGKRLREWMGIDSSLFYDDSKIAIVPMGFCYPGKGKSGDLPPRPECAPLWHDKLLTQMPNIKLTLLIGQYAQAYYLGNKMKKNLTETVKHYKEYLPTFLPLPHPSPRNLFWLKKNQWFESEILPILRSRVQKLITSK